MTTTAFCRHKEEKGKESNARALMTDYARTRVEITVLGRTGRLAIGPERIVRCNLCWRVDLISQTVPAIESLEQLVF